MTGSRKQLTPDPALRNQAILKRFIEDLQLKGLSQKTIDEELRQYFLYNKNVRKWSRVASTISLCGIKYFYTLTLKREWTSDIDSQRMFVHIRRGKGNKDRYVPLPQRTLEILRAFYRMHRKDWVCHIEPVGTGEAALKYLAPYIFRVALSDRNILSVQQRQVTFRYKDSPDGQYQTCSLPAPEFIHRFLQHVLPRGFVKVRYFGFLATKKRADLDRVKELIGRRLSRKSPPHPERKIPQRGIMRCPDCKKPMIFVCELPKQPSIGRGPPAWLLVI